MMRLKSKQKYIVRCNQKNETASTMRVFIPAPEIPDRQIEKFILKIRLQIKRLVKSLDLRI